ncbi:MAG: hypothetical protein QM811_02845 [Pirellulales bacterium]
MLLTDGNARYDELNTIQAIADPVERRTALLEFRDRLDELARSVEGLTSWGLMQQNKKNRSLGLAAILLARLLPPTTTLALGVDERGRMLFELNRVGFMLARYRAEVGRYPDHLDELPAVDYHAIPKDYALPAH